MLTECMLSVSNEKWAVMTMMNLLLVLVVGMFMKTTAALIIERPLG